MEVKISNYVVLGRWTTAALHGMSAWDKNRDMNVF
jgi:hypothetical protein